MFIFSLMAVVVLEFFCIMVEQEIRLSSIVLHTISYSYFPFKTLWILVSHISLIILFLLSLCFKPVSLS